jgi:hypothetical protein
MHNAGAKAIRERPGRPAPNLDCCLPRQCAGRQPNAKPSVGRNHRGTAFSQCNHASAQCDINAALDAEKDLNARMLPFRDTRACLAGFHFAQVVKADEQPLDNHVDRIDS